MQVNITKFQNVPTFTPTGTTFPKLTVCSKSLHSRQRLKENYPKVSLGLLHRFYGTAGTQQQKALWNKMAMQRV